MAIRKHDERGAALVEFALVLPVFMMLVLGMFTGGLAYSTKLSLNGAAREGTRYGATLSVANSPVACSGATNMERWLSCVENATIQAAAGDLDAGTEGRVVCVAYVHPAATGSDPVTASRTTTGSTTTTSGSPCFTDGHTNDVRRVQVRVVRTEELQALFFSRSLTLTSRAITRFEAIT